MEEGKTKQIDGHKIVMTTIFIVVTAVIFLAIGFMAGKNSATSETTALESATATSTVSINTSATADATVNWKTYANDKYSYSIKYPSSGWMPFNNDENAVDSQRVAFRLANYQFTYDPGYSKKSGEAVIFISTNPTDQILNQIVSSYANKTKKTINGVDFYLIDRTNETSDVGGYINDLVYIAVNDGIEYTIQLTPASPGALIVETFNQIANTFRFTK